jgi:hypothetical protein
MIRERHVVSSHFDKRAGTGTFGLGGGPVTKRRSVPGALLLGSGGVVVGVDVDPEGKDRFVALLPGFGHEDVEATRETTVEVGLDASDQASELRVQT